LEIELAAHLERPAGPLLHEFRDVVAVVVRIDDEQYRHDPDHDEPDQGADDDAGNFERTHESLVARLVVPRAKSRPLVVDAERGYKTRRPSRFPYCVGMGRHRSLIIVN